MGGSRAHEFMVLNPAGEDVLVLCETCGFSANRQVARGPARRPPTPRRPLPIEEVETPGTTTIADLAAFLGIDAGGDGQGRLLRDRRRPADHGDRARRLRRQRDEARQRGQGASAASGPATVEEIQAAGMEPGYGSPIGAHDTFVVVDELVARSPNLVAGANRVGFHLRNVNVGRDFTPDLVADIDERPRGRRLPDLRPSPVILRNGIEVGNIFKLGTQLHATRSGRPTSARTAQAHPIVMGSYGIGARAQRRLHRRGPPRREGHRLAGRGRAVRRPPRVDRREPGPAGRRGRRAAPRRRRPRPAARSCGTTATSRRA